MGIHYHNDKNVCIHRKIGLKGYHIRDMESKKTLFQIIENIENIIVPSFNETFSEILQIINSSFGNILTATVTRSEMLENSVKNELQRLKYTLVDRSKDFICNSDSRSAFNDLKAIVNDIDIKPNQSSIINGDNLSATSATNSSIDDIKNENSLESNAVYPN